MAAQADVTDGTYTVSLPIDATGKSVSGDLSVDGYEGSQQWTFEIAPPSPEVDLTMGSITPNPAVSDGQGVYHLVGTVSGIPDGSAVMFSVSTTDSSAVASSISSVQVGFALPSGASCSPGDADNELVCIELQDGQAVDLPVTLNDPSGATPPPTTVYITATPVGAIDTDLSNNRASTTLQAEAPRVTATVGEAQGANVPVGIDVANLVNDPKTLYVWLAQVQDGQISPLQDGAGCTADSTGRLTCSVTPVDGFVHLDVTAKAPPGQGGKDVTLEVSSIAFNAPTAGHADVHLQSDPGHSS
jgi:hypothetical protein